MKKLKTLALTTAVSLGLLGSNAAMAETQGSLGATSEGNFDITYVKGTLVRIWGLEDFAFDNQADGASLTKDVCVFSNGNSNSNQYKLTVTSGNVFKLIDGASNEADYTFDFGTKISGATTPAVWTNAAGNESNGDQVGNITAGALADQPNPNLDNCTSAEANAQISITIPTVPTTAGVYTDNVVLLVAPE
ncbi:hypothetical protein [Endozoicomonas acroporae]|uniref:hypothetical protein n=1 Tax=Endozoicomonas acroporae TaxID=1701104 RepID=UPI003D7AC6E2